MIIGIAARLARQQDEREDERVAKVLGPGRAHPCAKANASASADQLQIDLFRREIAQHTDK